MNHLYVSDLDGTLLQNNATLSAYSRSALQGMLADGLQFTVASARSLIAIQTILSGIPLRLPVIEFNGAFLSDLTTGRHEFVNQIEPAILGCIYSEIVGCDLVPFISSFNGREDCLHYGEAINDGMTYYLNERKSSNDSRLRPARNLAATLNEQIVCITIIADAGSLLDLQANLRELCGDEIVTHVMENQYSPGWYWLTVYNSQATKDKAIGALIESRGLKGSELVVFGDNINDLKMFQFADRAIAVGNAQPEAIRHADQVIGSNAEDAVVRYIQADWRKS